MGLLVETYGQGGQPGAAQQILSEALFTVQQTGERNYEAELHRLQGELHLMGRAERPGPAEAAFHRALEAARNQQARSLELRAAVSLGRLWQRQGRRLEAHRLLVEIYAPFSSGLDTQDVQDARTLLQELASGC